MDIYTIGHSNYSIERLIEMLKYFGIDCVVDIRGTPYSKYNVQFDKETIKYTLTKAAKRINKQSYNEEGYSDFEKVIYEDDFIKGIERLKVGCEKGYKIVLLGAMQDPLRCHRSILVGRALRKAGFNVKHILDDYSIASQEKIEEGLLDKYFSNRNQMTIDDLIGHSLTRKEMIQEGYRLANKEIGYRIEHL